jgi:hypothetical protein
MPIERDHSELRQVLKGCEVLKSGALPELNCFELRSVAGDQALKRGLVQSADTKGGRTRVRIDLRELAQIEPPAADLRLDKVEEPRGLGIARTPKFQEASVADAICGVETSPRRPC